MSIFPARIDTNGVVIASDRVITLHLDQNDEVQFTSQGKSGPWTVVFRDGSPFGSSRFTVPPTGNTRSGPPTGPRRTYKYDVEDQYGKVTDDPEVIIET